MPAMVTSSGFILPPSTPCGRTPVLMYSVLVGAAAAGCADSCRADRAADADAEAGTDADVDGGDVGSDSGVCTLRPPLVAATLDLAGETTTPVSPSLSSAAELVVEAAALPLLLPPLPLLAVVVAVAVAALLLLLLLSSFLSSLLSLLSLFRSPRARDDIISVV